MIKIIILKQKHISLGFKIEGHALSREEIESVTGEAFDLICNSVSVLSQSVIIGMQEVLKLPIKYEINDGSHHRAHEHRRRDSPDAEDLQKP